MNETQQPKTRISLGPLAEAIAKGVVETNLDNAPDIEEWDCPLEGKRWPPYEEILRDFFAGCAMAGMGCQAWSLGAMMDMAWDRAGMMLAARKASESNGQEKARGETTDKAAEFHAGLANERLGIIHGLEAENAKLRRKGQIEEKKPRGGDDMTKRVTLPCSTVGCKGRVSEYFKWCDECSERIERDDRKQRCLYGTAPEMLAMLKELAGEPHQTHYTLAALIKKAEGEAT